MATQGCKWTEEWGCPGETSYQGSEAGEAGKAENDQSIGYHCCCQKDFFDLSDADIETAVENGAGLTKAKKKKLEEKLEEKEEGKKGSSKLNAVEKLVKKSKALVDENTEGGAHNERDEKKDEGGAHTDPKKPEEEDEDEK